MELNDAAVVDRARRDPQAFGLLYDRYVQTVYRFAYSRLQNVAAAEDVTAEVFTKALRGLGGYREQGRPFSCWLYQIARNAITDYYRHEPLTRALSDVWPDGRDAIEAGAIQRDELRQLWRLIDRLPTQQRTAMILRFRDDRSLAEVGEIMGKSEGAAKLLIFRAVQRIRAEVAPADHPVPRRLVATA